MKRVFLVFLAITLLLLCGTFVSCNYGGDTDTDDDTDTTVSYTVSFDCDGGSAITSQTVTKNGKVTKPSAPTKAGYEFAGWYNGNEQWSFAENTVTSDLTLKAKWTPVEYQAKFYADGTLVDTVTFTVEDGSLSRVPNPPIKNGYTAVWSEYTLGMNNITVNAIYTPITYTVTFKADGVTVATKNFNVENTTVIAPEVPNKNGYTGAWESYTLGTENITVNAVYTLETYTITYNNLDGASNPNPTTFTILTDNIVLQDLTSNDSVFEGWYDLSGNRVYTIPKGTFGNISLTARWSGKFSVSFDTDGGSLVASQLIIPGGKVTQPSSPAKTGYEFAGWYYNGTAWNFTSDTVTSDITLVAKWEAITYTITYRDLNGSLNTNPTTYTIESDTIVLSPLSLAGYDFVGWKNEQGDIVTTIQNGSTGNLTLYATFELDAQAAIFIFAENESGMVIIGCNDLNVTSLTIPSYITKIDANAFKGCLSLTSVTVESSSTIIEENAFWGCISLTSITVEETSVSIKTCYTYEEYLALTSNEQENYYSSFRNASDFFVWKNKAFKEYEDTQNREEIGGDGEVDLG